MIGRLVEWSTRNVGLVLFLTAGIVAAGLYAVRATPVDAIPDLSDTQVIVYTDFPGQSPQVVEDQVTFPLSTAFLSVPGSRVVRGFSFFGVSFVYVIFEDGTDLYWARSRVLEYLNAVAATLPDGAQPRLGPDATGVGWIFQYALTGAGLDLAELRSLQDWQLRFRLAALDGVSEVAGVGGQVRQYQVTVDPLALRDLGLSLDDVAAAIRASSSEVGGRTLELAEREYMIRGLGYLRGLEDLRTIPVAAARGTPVLLGDIATVAFGPDERRGPGGAGRARRGGKRHRDQARRRERAGGDRAGEAGAGGDLAQPARGRRHRDRLRPFRPDRALDCHAARHAARRKPRGVGRLLPLPAARPLCAGRYRYARRWAC